MNQQTDLTEELDELVKLLATAGELRWRKFIADCRSKIASGNYSGVERLLGAYGGMGSLNDVCGSSDTNHAALQEALGRVYDLATTIRRSRALAGA